VSDRSAAELLKFVKDHGLEGVVAKRAEFIALRDDKDPLKVVRET
jgi:hypothetical protein